MVRFPPLHFVSLGSGSHSPFLIHVDEFGPVSTSPRGHVRCGIPWPIAETIIVETLIWGSSSENSFKISPHATVD